jgi:transcription-repair coupling factor (superfamily II helicase)
VRPLAIKGEILVIHSDKYSDIENLDSNTVNDNLKEIIDFNPFKIGDLLIHEKYGLGQYEGLEVVKTDNLFNEYIKIKYANEERLYVPLRNINLLSKYHKSVLSEDIEFDSISSNKWLKKKDKALKQAYDHAAEILDMESRRANSSSISLRISDNDFKKFNNEFPYTETSDQLIAVNSIRKDMELIKPMNRLLCGDVGFGKTEVAMRAAFISAFSEKQVIVLCPSTILARQHYESFIERFNSFPVNIDLLTRHVSIKNKDKIIASYNSANIDILISTHAIFNQNINYSDTGLLIVDEEHRFGIKQKDLIKSKQDNIHILYLSATPIPRTMNFVFSGLKDFSFLNTPPINRLSIKSFLKISDDTILKESLSREIQRGGQCFVLQNNIERMDALKSRILKILPDLKVGIAHGRLNKREISEVMQAFSSGQLDVLICTTIVEMGLDIPNANTMIIEDSHKLGLAQLHQIRGRIGRSNKQGYCYFLIPHNDIPKIASDRLDSIIRNSKLGSGYFIAQEDMELRGSGEILGDKQSGHISSIGLSLYLSMLKSAIKLNKDKTKTELIKTDVNFYDSAFISDSYMPSTVERLKIYKLVYEANSGEDIYKIKSHLQDTCGKIPVEVNNLLLNATINNLIGRLKISKLTSTSECTSLKLTKSITDELLMKLLDISKKDHDKYYFDNQNKFNIKLNEADSSLRREKIIKFLNEII